MSGPLRSKQGCWTCRLRKKKCDETQPTCALCKSLSIPCYGFGPKPEWMDNGKNEKAVSDGLKEIVKHTWKRKVTSQVPIQAGHIRIAPKALDGSMASSVVDVESESQNRDRLLSDATSLQQDEIDMLRDGPAKSLPAEFTSQRSIFSMPADNSVLLMHFLDNIFPHQFPMYRPEILDGGRGWLLSILLRTEPLYHAALALSIYHRETIITFSDVEPACRVAALLRQEKHLEVCIKSLSQFAQNSCPLNGLGILTSVVQLVFFELYTSYSGTWQPHLHAAIGIYQRAQTSRLEGFGLSKKAHKILREDLVPSGYDPEVTGEVANFRFLTGALIWLDINFSITAGRTPQLLPQLFTLTTTDSQIKLENIVGCKNLLVLQIGRIAALHERKLQFLQHKQPNCEEIIQTSDYISREIQRTAYQASYTSDQAFSTISPMFLDDSALFTSIFVSMASIYLHIVIHGFQNLDFIDASVCKAMRVLQTLVSKTLLPALICPLFIIGSVAKREDEEFFRKIFSSSPLPNPLLKHRQEILPVLEIIWSRRQTSCTFSWKDSLELTHNILLV